MCNRTHRPLSPSPMSVCVGEGCRCLRFIPEKDANPNGPQLCRDCRHWESSHPVREEPKVSVVSDLLARLKPKASQIHKTETPTTSKAPAAVVSDDEARRETSAGFRKAEGLGRGGATKYKVRFAHPPVVGSTDCL
jgi:hypothetical protein